MSRTLTARFAFVLLCLPMLALGVGGCKVAGMVAYMVAPPKVKALYVPPKTPMLVLVENRQNPGMFIYSSDQLTSYIIDDLQTYEVCPVVPDEKLQRFYDATPDASKMTISQIGKAVGAAQVLYVDVKRIGVGAVPGIPTTARAEASIRVVDVATGKTMFPQTGDGYPITFQSQISQDAMKTEMTQARDAMTRDAGTDIARLFHDYMPG